MMIALLTAMLRAVMNPNLIEEARRRSVRFRLDEVAVVLRRAFCAFAYRGRSAQRNRSHHGQWIGTAASSNLGYSLRLLRPSPVTARRDVVGALHAWQAPDDRHAASGNGIGRDNRLRQDEPPLIAARVRAGHQFG